MGRLKEISLKKNVALKVLYALICLACARIVSQPLILCFHRVKVSSGSLLDKRVGCISPGNFRRVLRFVRLMGYRFVAVEELVNMIKERKSTKVAAVTFDDGFKDLYENAYPVLKEGRIPFTLFLITSLLDSNRLLWLHRLYMLADKLTVPGRNAIFQKYVGWDENGGDTGDLIGKLIHANNRQTLSELESEVSAAAKSNDDDEPLVARDLYLSEEQIEEMKGHGLTIEAHGHEHWPFRSLDREETKNEIEDCVEFIRGRLNCSPKFLALQYGKTNEHVRDVAETCGLKGIATMQGRLIREGFRDPYSLPRFCIYDNVQSFYRELSIEFVKTVLTEVRESVKVWNSR